MLTLVVIASAVGCIVAVGRGVIGRVAFPEPVFLGSDGFGC